MDGGEWQPPCWFDGLTIRTNLLLVMGALGGQPWSRRGDPFRSWALRRCAKNHLDAGFPVAGPPMAMSNGQDLDGGG